MTYNLYECISLLNPFSSSHTIQGLYASLPLGQWVLLAQVIVYSSPLCFHLLCSQPPFFLIQLDNGIPAEGFQEEETFAFLAPATMPSL